MVHRYVATHPRSCIGGLDIIVFTNSSQLRPIIERALREQCDIEPEVLEISPRYLLKSQDIWEVETEVFTRGERLRLVIGLDPSTGRLRKVVRCVVPGPTQDVV